MVRLTKGDFVKLGVGCAVVVIVLMFAAEPIWTGGDLSFLGLSWSLRGGSTAGEAGCQLDEEQVATWSFPAADVTGLEIGWTGGDVRVERGPGDEVVVFERIDAGTYGFDPLKTTAELRDGVVSIDDGLPDSTGGEGCDGKHLTVTLPEDASFSLDGARIDSASADIAVDGLTCASLAVETMSGGASLTGLDAREARTATMSGDLELQGRVTGGIEASSQSGGQTLALAVAPQRISIATMSGDAVIDLPDDAGFTFEGSSMSGEMTCDLPGKLEHRGDGTFVYGDGSTEVSCSSMSGSVRFR